MKALFRAILLLAVFAFSIIACDKPSGGGGDTPPPAEENLVVALNPDPGSTTTPVRSTSATYTFSVVIQSAMPTQGVEVKVEFKQDRDGTVLYSNTVSTGLSPISISIPNLPLNEVGTVTIVVTSRSKPSNTVTKTFKLVRK